MGNEEHLSEEVLNMYLDKELDAGERGRVEAHLAACEPCRTEMRALRGLFAALGELEATPAPAPNLVPSVLARVRPRRGLAAPARLWLAPALQAIAALALLAWGWSQLVRYWTVIAGAAPLEALERTGAWAAEWIITRWTELSDLPSAVWAFVQVWATRPALYTAPNLPLPQLAMVGVALVVLWLASNAVLLRRALLNGRRTR